MNGPISFALYIIYIGLLCVIIVYYNHITVFIVVIELVSFSFILFMYHPLSYETINGNSHHAHMSIIYYLISSFVGYTLILISYVLSTPLFAISASEHGNIFISLFWHFGLFINLGVFPVVFIVPQLVNGSSNGALFFLLIISNIVLVLVYTNYIPTSSHTVYSYYLISIIMFLTMLTTLWRIYNTVIIWEVVMYGGLNTLSIVIWILYISTVLNPTESGVLIQVENLFWVWAYMIGYSIVIIATIWYLSHTFPGPSGSLTASNLNSFSFISTPFISHWNWYSVLIFLTLAGLPPVAFFFINMNLLNCAISTPWSIIILFIYVFQSIIVATAFVSLVLVTLETQHGENSLNALLNNNINHINVVPNYSLNFFTFIAIAAQIYVLYLCLGNQLLT